MSETNYNCAKCKKLLEISNTICDNDCKTVYCENCGQENYFDLEKNTYQPIHDPQCGEEVSED